MTTAQKHAAISTMILAKVAEGMDIADAMDAVMGAGSYKAMVSRVYHALRAKQGLE